MGPKKHILIGVTASVSVIKIPGVIGHIRSCAKANNDIVEIRIVATRKAVELFSSSLTSENVEVLTDEDVVAPYSRGDPILHIELRRWADIFVICPLDCNTLGKIAHGLCDNLLTDVARCWDFKKPIWAYPCMNPLMYEHPLTGEQIAKIESFGVKSFAVITVVEGYRLHKKSEKKYTRNYSNYKKMGTGQSSMNDKLRETRQEINRAVRELERNRLRYEREEKSLMQKLRSEARSGRMQNLRVIAKDLVRARRMGVQYCNMKSQMSAIMGHLQTAHSTNMMSNSLKNVNKIISGVSQNHNVAEFQRLMYNLGRESEVMNLKLDVMSESLDNGLEDVESAEEEDLIITQVLEELGIDGSAAMPSLGFHLLKKQNTQAVSHPEAVCELNNGHYGSGMSPAEREASDIAKRIRDLRGEE
ncbi:Phosphopantothenoylcysteine decarboxylase [Babesia sp. Xinjiang]|uniref:Phosphopantothenoylcysteine decarboxylase n=1 Tax=Babesia sp. Xinjiang TaxID=462227 RepID=UPI000A258F74|nr:Phosphopantothenoylcysteine decarboxylase [Babesia sp. Xinjiang]XP_028871486.1 Phosphopantothenoylcysteine decarboxylase [Babesia sp. Xinjiang]ORM40924.1 Phosphopantothenoylcysteine decarboxylase [Babesia sp. Xinjiang]ORM41030.1 Phosphopantothenoylcysteine decarboxylase [Babesia sp. Xinjiang]